MSLSYLITGVKNKKEILILLGIAFIVWVVYFRINFNGLVTPDAMYYATIARNIIRGDGYQANVTDPFNFTYLRTSVFTPSVNPPLFPYILAFFFKTAGISARVSALCTGFFFLISIIPLYLLSYRLFGRLAAVITSIIFILEPTMLWYSISGLTESTFIFFMLFAFLFLFLFYEKEKSCYILLAGVCIGLCKLTRFNGSVFIVVIIATLFLFTKGRRLRICALFVSGVVLTNIPTLVSVLFAKTPMLAQGMINCTAIDDTPHYPLGTIAKMLDPMSSWEYIRTYPRDFIYKYSQNVFYYCKNFFTMINPIVTALFTVSFMSFESNRVVRILLFILGLSILAQIALISYIIPIIRYFYIFIPFIIIFGVGFFFERFYQTNCSVSYKAFLFLLVVMVLLSTTMIHTVFTKSYKVLFQNYESKETVMVKQQSLIGEFIRKNTKKNDFIATDYCSIGWYADRKTLSLPISFDVLETIDFEYKRVDAILLTSASNINDIRMLSGVGQKLVEWREILTNPPKILGEYVLCEQGIIRDEKFVFYKREDYQE